MARAKVQQTLGNLWQQLKRELEDWLHVGPHWHHSLLTSQPWQKMGRDSPAGSKDGQQLGDVLERDLTSCLVSLEALLSAAQELQSQLDPNQGAGPLPYLKGQRLLPVCFNCVVAASPLVDPPLTFSGMAGVCTTVQDFRKLAAFTGGLNHAAVGHSKHV